MMNRRTLVTLSASIALGMGALAFVTQAQAQAQAHEHEPSQLGQRAHHQGGAIPPLSQSTVSQLEAESLDLGHYEKRGGSWVPASQQSKRGGTHPLVLTETSAISSAASAIGVSTSSPVVAASLTTLTTPEYGTELQSDPNLPSNIDPTFTNTPTWAIEFSGVQIPTRGTATDWSGESSANMTTVNFVVFVDASTGALMMGTDITPTLN